LLAGASCGNWNRSGVGHPHRQQNFAYVEFAQLPRCLLNFQELNFVHFRQLFTGIGIRLKILPTFAYLSLSLLQFASFPHFN
jgi:hypothetical protein